MSDINIVFTRVDNRLVHGQVGNVWVTASGANLILVVDDETCHDELSKSLMKMTADAVGVQIRFFSIKKTIEIIGKAAPSQKIFIVAKTPQVIEQLVDGGVPIKHCNIGNMSSVLIHSWYIRTANANSHYFNQTFIRFIRRNLYFFYS